MSTWAEASSSAAGGIILLIGALVPKVILALNALLDKLGKKSSETETEKTREAGPPLNEPTSL